MRTDIVRVVKVTEEARLNEKLYQEMREELNQEIKMIATLNPKLICKDFEKLYFWRRIISVVQNHDLPYRCVVGLLSLSRRLEVLSSFRDSFIADDDSDTEIYKFILEFGYRMFGQKLRSADGSQNDDEPVKLYQKPKKEGDDKYDE